MTQGDVPDRPGSTPVADTETIEELDRAERRRRWAAIGVLVAIAVAAVVYLVLPRTVASGELNGEAWQLRIAPIAVGSSVSLTGSGADDVGEVRVARTGGLEETVVWQLGRSPELDELPGDVGATIVVGPTPSGVDSVRVTSDVRAREARIVRVGWQRYHVAQLPGHVDIDEIVAIDAGGRPTEVDERSMSPNRPALPVAGYSGVALGR